MNLTHEPIIKILNKELETRRSKNSSYSMRAFAKYLEIDPSNLSKILAAQKVIGPRLKKKLALRLGLSVDEINQIGDKNYHEFNIDQFSLISEPHHFAILELLKLKNKKSSKAWISKTLEISEVEVESAITRLIGQGLLKESNGEYVEVVGSTSSTISSKTSRAQKNQQKEILEMAIKTLDKVPVEHRSQSSMIMAIQKSKISEAKLLIKNFQRNLEQFLSTDATELDDVYNLSISLYPTTNIFKGDQK